ncbi:hypothetical protein TEHAL1_02080 [Tetragenococcus halophilus]|nr:hypothetical protein TEHAL1_02080 [Tetragenococcus halophilus]GMQ74721.1 hypothetical protein TEHSL10_23570 [Tetragenococcus halophilus]
MVPPIFTEKNSASNVLTAAALCAFKLHEKASSKVFLHIYTNHVLSKKKNFLLLHSSFVSYVHRLYT